MIDMECILFENVRATPRLPALETTVLVVSNRVNISSVALDVMNILTC